MKPILCFFVGYTPDYTGPETDAYGSELALKRMSELLTQKYMVYIFGTSFQHKIINRVVFMHSSYLKDFSKMNKIDVMIISRYVYYFLENTISARKTYIWLHDTLLQPYWNGIALPDGGKQILENVFPQIDGIITLCDWHKQNVLHNFNVDPNKVFIIGNGIDLEKFNQSTTTPEKVKNRFIYMSCPNRGLLRLVSHFHKIREHLPDAELHIYRGIDPSNRQVLDELEKYPYIKYMGKVPNQQLIPEIQKAEYWYYPTDFYETYCISALEAQMSGCICITSNIGALTNTIEDRGFLLSESVYGADYQNKALEIIINLDRDPNLKQSYIEKAQEWAKKQTWENRLPEWLNLLQ